MGLEQILTSDSVLPNVHARCKREALATMAAHAADMCDLDELTIFDALMEREKLGSTGVGYGVAIPHGKISGLGKIVGFMAKLADPVDFDSVDGEPVDLIVVLLAPQNATAAHLKALAKVSRRLRDEPTREALRGAESCDAILAILTQEEHSNAA